LTVLLYAGDKLLDKTVVHHGFRWYRFDADKGFFLNGKPMRLHGVNRHQDYKGLGNALPLAQHARDIGFIKDIGANWLRLAHYPQDNYVLELCDRKGIFVWQEIPWVGKMSQTEAFAANCENQLREMIEQRFNHPCVLLWGISNELLLGKDKPDTGMLDLLKHLNDVVHEEDPGRLSVLACHKSDNYAKYGLTTITDVVGYNLYYGWYYNDVEDLTAGLEAFHKASPDKPLIVSEYGPGADINIHSPYPGIYDFSQEWQVYYHESYLDQFDKMPWLAGTNAWNMFDFGSAKRGDTIPCVNQKGIMTFDRKPKDVFYLYKARWSNEPVIYIQGANWTKRSGTPQKTFRVLTNCDKVELFHNGRSLGTQTTGFRWNVTLDEGANRLLAIGMKGRKKVRHSMKLEFTASPPLDRAPLRINCGGDDYTDVDGNLWVADHSYVDVEGSWGAISGEAKYDSKLHVTGTNDSPLFQHYREGTHGYHFDLPAGKYTIKLGLFDPAVAQSDKKSRVFDIYVQGRKVQAGWVYSTAIQSQRAVWKSFEAEVKDGRGLDLRFVKERHNYSMICAVEVNTSIRSETWRR
ncbi:MAG: DUF4982 domain-containing protein, partial [Candidatus Hydrogenedentes bacterium]|nr:DUF4982 domain-containing protein [Candidatus Hydrogenedentota bacterium]